MGKSGDERRQYPRSRTGFPVAKEKSGPGEITYVDNISCSGILCHTRKAIAEMTKMFIALDLPEPDNQMVEAEGVVVRCVPDEDGADPFKVAILYTSVNDEDLERIREYVERDLEDPDED